MTIWNKLKHFKPSENWGNPEKINGLLLLLLDEITDRVKKAAKEEEEAAICVIHCAYDKRGHAANSQHYKGNAVDFSIRGGFSAKKSHQIILQTLKDWQLEDKVGLGVYPDWFNQGFHLDVRGEKARWVEHLGKYHYDDLHIQQYLKLLK